MRQPIRKGKLINNKKPKVNKKLRKPNGKVERTHPKFGTSKLEQDFAEQFLDRLGVDYIWQFEAKDIGRFYDFKIKDGPIIEINGSYWHGDPRIYEEKDLNKTQKNAKKIDEYKEKWALVNGIPIYYIWEKDIRENPSKVMEFLKKILYKVDISKNKNKRHKNRLFL